MGRKVIKKIYILLIVLFVLTISLGGYKYLKASRNIHQKDKIYQKYDQIKEIIDNYSETKVDTTLLKNDNVLDNEKIIDTININDVKGIIKISGANINEFIMQSSDNVYYLNHLENGEYNELGSITLDYRNNLIDDKISIIYGHSSYIVNTPFGNLENYYDKNFYNNNKYITIEKNNEDIKYQIFTVFVISKSDNKHVQVEFSSDEHHQKHLNWLSEVSLYDTGINVSINDQVLILQTCSTKYKDSFLIIGGRKVK